MAEEQKNTTPSKKLPTIAIVAIGCAGLLVIVSIILGIAGKALFSQIGQKFIGNSIQKGIEDKTGISVETGKNGEIVSLKDKNNGTEVNIGGDTVPSDFPRDFPLYPGAKVTNNISGNNKDTGQGFWLMMDSGDAVGNVTKFYESELKKSGWLTEENVNIANASTWQISKGSLEGSVVVNGEDQAKKTTILITLSEKQAEESQTGE